MLVSSFNIESYYVWWNSILIWIPFLDNLDYILRNWILICTLFWQIYRSTLYDEIQSNLNLNIFFKTILNCILWYLILFWIFYLTSLLCMVKFNLSFMPFWQSYFAWRNLLENSCLKTRLLHDNQSYYLDCVSYARGQKDLGLNSLHSFSKPIGLGQQTSYLLRQIRTFYPIKTK